MIFPLNKLHVTKKKLCLISGAHPVFMGPKSFTILGPFSFKG